MLNSNMIPTITNYTIISDSIEAVKSKNPTYKAMYNYETYVDESVISLIEQNIPILINSDIKLLEIKRFHEIEWLHTKPFLQIGMLLISNDEFWYVEYSYHNGFIANYYSSVYDFLIKSIHNIQLSFNTLALQPELYRIIYNLKYLKMHPHYNYILMEKVNNNILNYSKYLCKYNERIYYILYDFKYNNHILFCL